MPDAGCKLKVKKLSKEYLIYIIFFLNLSISNTRDSLFCSHYKHTFIHFKVLM